MIIQRPALTAVKWENVGQLNFSKKSRTGKDAISANGRIIVKTNLNHPLKILSGLSMAIPML